LEKKKYGNAPPREEGKNGFPSKRVKIMTPRLKSDGNFFGGIRGGERKG